MVADQRGTDSPAALSDLVRVPAHTAYRTVRQNITELVGRSPSPEQVVVPGCPEWTVRDVVAHLASNSARMVGQEPPDGGLAEQVADWSATGPRVERLVAETGQEIGRLLMDAFTHELDLREALEVATPADHPAYPLAFGVVTGGLSYSIGGHGLPALRLRSDGAEWVAGPGEPAATVSAPRHALYRSLTGRRTPAQIAALDWTDDPQRWLPAFYWGPFNPPAGRP